MSRGIIIVDSSEIQAGKVSAVEKAMKALVELVASKEPRMVSYGVFFDGGRTRVTVVQVHPDSASAELHMTIAAPVFAKFGDLLRLRAMDVYGAPSPALVKLLERKARLLGAARVEIHTPHVGILRAAPA